MAKAKKLPSGNWRVQATVNGVTKSFTAKSAKEAEESASKWQLGISNPEICSNLTLEEAYIEYIKNKSNILSPSTIKGYHSLLHNTFQSIMPIKLSNLSTPLIQKEVNIIAASHSPKYTRNAYGLLSAVLAMFHPYLNLKVRMPAKERPKLYIPDDNDISKLLKAVEGTKMEIPILLAAFGPMRRGEICALTSDDISGNIVTVNKALVKDSNNEWQLKVPKTYSSFRQIHYPDFVIEKIKNIKGKITDLTPNAITDAFPKILRKAELPNFRFHDLRHYAVSTLHAMNVPDKYIMARGGWETNYTMNNVYNHTLKNKIDETEEKILKHFAKVYGE